MNVDTFGTTGTHGDQIPVISQVLVKLMGVKLRLGVKVWISILVTLSTMNRSKCNVPTRIAVQTCVCVCVCGQGSV